MYINKCTKCGAEFETKNPKRLICPNCLYPDRKQNGEQPSDQEQAAKTEYPNGYSSSASFGGTDERLQRSYDRSRYERNNSFNRYDREIAVIKKIMITIVKAMVIVSREAMMAEILMAQDLRGIITAVINAVMTTIVKATAIASREAIIIEILTVTDLRDLSVTEIIMRIKEAVLISVLHKRINSF